MHRIVPGILALWFGLALFASGDVAELLKQARSKDIDQRRNAFKELGEAMAEAKVVLPTLLEGLKDDDRYVRRFAAQAIGSTSGVDAKTVLPSFTRIINDKKEAKDVLDAVASSLGKMGPPAVDPLARLVKDKERDVLVRQRAVQSLGLIGLPAKAAVPALLETLQGRGNLKGMNLDSSIRLETVNALGKIATSKDQEVLKMLEGIQMEKNKDRNFKSAVNQALKNIKKRK